MQMHETLIPKMIMQHICCVAHARVCRAIKNVCSVAPKKKSLRYVVKLIDYPIDGQVEAVTCLRDLVHAAGLLVNRHQSVMEKRIPMHMNEHTVRVVVRTRYWLGSGEIWSKRVSPLQACNVQEAE